MARRFAHLGDTEIFCRAAEDLSFSRAAEYLGVTPAAVSRAITRTEERLGVRLFRRTTRSITLTDAGRLYHQQARTALTMLGDVEGLLRGQQDTPSGRLRISVPTTFGHHRLLPRIHAFRAAYPAIDLEIDVSNRNIDFVDEGFDLAIRMGELPDSRLIARKLADMSLGLFASPEYLQHHATPGSIEELAACACIAFQMPSTGRISDWSLRVGDRDLEWTPPDSLLVAHDVLGCVTLAANGAGIMQSYHFITQPLVESGRLVEILTEFSGRTRPFSALYPKHRNLSHALKVFVEFLESDVRTTR
ncbi:MAG: LysR family transcriptional regulator [Gammaproteobacteria bacterium]|nr:LysR family transcriptional regulator [Gammaproteobacteria bacterium]